MTVFKHTFALNLTSDNKSGIAAADITPQMARVSEQPDFHRSEDLRRNTLHYSVLVQCADELHSIENAPAISMARYLTEGDRLRSIPTISIYSQRGYDRANARLLYMNATALAVWQEMGRFPCIIGQRYRPPQSATLAFGVPFSE